MAAATESHGAGGSPLGPNLVINGTFVGNDTTGYTNVRNTNVSNDELNATGGLNPLAGLLLDSPQIETGKTYRATLEVTAYTAGAGVNFIVGGTSGPTQTTALGIYTADIVAAGDNADLVLTFGSNTTMSVDNITLQEVL